MVAHLLPKRGRDACEAEMLRQRSVQIVANILSNTESICRMTHERLCGKILLIRFVSGLTNDVLFLLSARIK